ncbi:helix-turn-helix transcriptional regulator [Saccharopolyspora shandongensis]|uniref:helix-turn-helix domain-containing protein n=1 Tax=Saccharopolyspora shandongensis TaxID=418495 RepID=UPI0034432725
MPNERLRAAIRAAGLTIEDLAQELHVDPKTAGRWITADGRVPHPGNRRDISNLVGVDEVHLWPSLAESLHVKPNTETELVHLYPSRSSVPFSLWTELIASVKKQMDVLVFSGQFLVEQHNILPVVRQKATEGASFRFMVGDETSTAVTQRAMEEGTTGGLQGRIQMMRRYLAEVASHPNVEVRTHGTILYNSLYRFDDNLLVNGHAFGALAGQNPVLHLQQLPGGLMWENYMRSFDRVWEQARPESF